MPGQPDRLGVGPLRTLNLLAAVGLLVPGAAGAATRTYSVASFERLRVDGPVEVRLETGAPPRASVDADEALLDRVTVSQQGETLVVRVDAGGWGERGAAPRAGAPAIVTLSTPTIRSASVNAGARVSITRVKGQQVNLSVNGSGAISAGVDADQLQATVIGAGSLTLTGRAARARLLTNGPGSIDAGALVADELSVRLDGTGETRANARYTAQVTDTGLGRVSVSGAAKCAVVAPAGGPVECGAGVLPQSPTPSAGGG